MNHDIAASGCSINWEYFPRTLAYGGALQPMVTSVAQCQNACVQNGSCLAIDFNDLNQCFFHVNTNWDDNIVTNKEDVNQWVLKKSCGMCMFHSFNRIGI